MNAAVASLGRLLRRPRGWGATVALVAWTGAAALAQASTTLPGGAAPDGELRALLARIHDAATRINYVGTLVDTSEGTVSSSRVTHYCEGHNQFVRIDALDGDARAVLRINDEMRTLWPQRKMAVIEPFDPRATFPALVSGSEQRVPDFYELRRLSEDRVAGHDAERLLLKARDAHRFDHMVWVERTSGLLLRVDVQKDGQTLESSAFSDVRIGVRPQPGTITAELSRMNGYRMVKASLQPTRLSDEGWSVQERKLPPGFQALGCVRRALPGITSGGVQSTLLQAMFSDGLTAVSLFIEPDRRGHARVPGLTVSGATHTLTQPKDDFWFTAVGDVPSGTLEQFIQAVDHHP